MSGLRVPLAVIVQVEELSRLIQTFFLLIITQMVQFEVDFGYIR